MLAQAFNFQLWKDGDLRAEEAAPIAMEAGTTGAVILRPYTGSSATYYRVQYRTLDVSTDPQWEGWTPALVAVDIDGQPISPGMRPAVLHRVPNSRPCDLVHIPCTWNRGQLRESIARGYATWKVGHPNHDPHTDEQIDAATDWWIGMWTLEIRCAGPAQEWEVTK